MSDIYDLIASIRDSKPNEAMDIFNELIHNKAVEAIQQKREEIANTYFGEPEDADD